MTPAEHIVTDDRLDRLTRPIIGIENRTPQEAFDIMCYRIRVALTELQHRRAEGAAYVSVRTMKTSLRPDGSTADFFVSIRVGTREVTPHVFRERFKAEYHVALYDWLLNGGHEPELMAFREDEWPARKLGPGPDLAASPSSPASGVRVKPLEWRRYPEKGTMTEGLNERREYVSRAELPWGAAFLMKSGDTYSFAGAFGEELGKYDAADAATNAFQAAFDAKVLSALWEQP